MTGVGVSESVVVRSVGAIVTVPLIAFGAFLLLRGDPGDGFQGPLIVGITSAVLGLLVFVLTFGGRWLGNAAIAGLAFLALLPYRELVGSTGLVVNLACAALALLLLWQRRSSSAPQ